MELTGSQEVNTAETADLSPAALQVMEYAIEEARQMGNDYFGTEHLLVGVLREGENVAARVLLHHGVSLERVRQEIEAMTGGLPSA